MEESYKEKLAVLLIAIFCCILYSNSLGNPFVFDDLHTIVNNLFIKSFRYIPLFFQGTYTSETTVGKGMLRPFLMVTFSLNYFFSGLKPFGYHCINILIHFLNAVLLFQIINCLKKNLSLAVSLGAVLLFVCHPINTQTISYITCRSDLLVTFFILAGVSFYLKGKKLLALAMYPCALLTKESALVFGLLILIYDLIVVRPQGPLVKAVKDRGIFYIGVIVISIAYWQYRYFMIGSSAGILAPLASPLRSFSANVLTQSAVLFFALRLFLWPYPLSIHHSFPTLTSVYEPAAFLSVLGIGVLIGIICLLRKKQPWVSFGLAWYGICQLPKFYAVLNIVAAEHHFYCAGIGLYFIAALVLDWLYRRWKQVTPYLYACVLGIFIILVWMRNYEWSSATRLWKSVLKTEPSSTIALHNLGVEYLNAGYYSKAKNLITQSLVLSNTIENQVTGRINLAYVAEKEGLFSEAERLLLQAEGIDNRNYHIFNFLGRVYLAMGKQQDALRAWEKGLSINPVASEMLIGLGQLSLLENDPAAAKEYFQSAIKADPDSSLGYYGLGQAYEEQADLLGAIKAYEKSVRLNPGYYPSQYSLGTCYANKADVRALRHLKEAVNLNPDAAEAHNNLAIVYSCLQAPRNDLARFHAQKALSLGYPVNTDFLATIQESPAKEKKLR
ncbi:MAG: tetratricopeptide repeat protein [Candidatus Omnitrophota bacterium]|jgi:tetratricopeptide (TPR) repeat protein